ncbi:MAG: hypothetical protein ACTSRU_12255 [Candidatus Hodarchaeales archaeon]
MIESIQMYKKGILEERRVFFPPQGVTLKNTPETQSRRVITSTLEFQAINGDN